MTNYELGLMIVLVTILLLANNYLLMIVIARLKAVARDQTSQRDAILRLSARLPDYGKTDDV